MRLILISDIHGNTVALDAVLADARPRPHDVVVCLGDIAAGGPDPGGAIDRIAELGGINVRGNTDSGMVDMPSWWLDPASIGLPESVVPGLDTCVWGAEQLSDSQRAWLDDLPPTATIDIGEAGSMLAFHGSPRDENELITATTTDEAMDEMCAGTMATMYAGGHTHVPLVRRFGERTMLNPGSVGMPFAAYGFAGGVAVLPRADYAIVTIEGSEVSVDLRQVTTDEDALESMADQSGMPHTDWWLRLRRVG